MFNLVVSFMTLPMIVPQLLNSVNATESMLRSDAHYVQGKKTTPLSPSWVLNLKKGGPLGV